MLFPPRPRPRPRHPLVDQSIHEHNVRQKLRRLVCCTKDAEQEYGFIFIYKGVERV